MDERPDTPFGLWLIDKPAGPTSHDIVHRIRGVLPRGTRVGHAGTLDPFASGLLLVAVGRATRLLTYLTGLDKSYRARVAFGAVSETGDTEGPITPTGAAIPDAVAVQAAVSDLPGVHRQRVPALAAVKVGGEPLYRRTRRGEQVALPERDITVHRAALTTTADDGSWADLEVRCSKGTYIRRLVSDLGEALGCGAYCAALRRLAIGTLRVEDAVAPEDVTVQGGVDPLEALDLPRREVEGAEYHDAINGRLVPGAATGPVALVAAGRLVAVAHPRDGGMLRPKVVVG